MKQKYTFSSFFTFFIFVLGSLLAKTTLLAQTYCYEFNETVVGTTLEVDIILTPSSPFRLGNTAAKFSVNPLSISLVNPIQFISALPATYSTSVSSPSLGTIAFSATYTGAVGAGKNVPTSGLKVGKMVFNIINPLITADFKLFNKGIKNLVLLKDDNSTVLAPSSQCPPSPYTSLFYDAHIELDVEIPMDECVESTTPNSVKINFGDDETKEILPTGFTFNFYCKQVTSLRLGADGALLVNASPTAVLPSTNQGKFNSIPQIIAPWWDEWRKGMGTINCLVKNTTLDGVPTRMLIIQWNGVSPADNITGSNLNTDPMKATFNVVIFENSSVIKFNYKDIDFTTDIAGRPDLLPVVEQKQNGVNGSVGMKGACGTGLARDGVNNIVFDGPIGISLFDVNSARVYKSITFKPITENCLVPLDPLDFKVCQNSSPFKIPFTSPAINGRWTGTGVPFLNNPNIQLATFNPTTAGNFTLKWEPECPEFGFTVNIIVSPTATVNAGVDQTLCSSRTLTLSGVIGGSAIGSVWSAPSGTFSDVNALTSTYTAGIQSGTVTLTLTTVNADATCPVVTSSFNVTVFPAVYAGEDGSMNICKDATLTTTINLFDLITGEQSGGTWTRSAGSGGIFNATAGTFTTAANMTSSIFRYTLIGTSPCPNDESRVAINIISPPNAGNDGSTAVCDNSTVEIDLRSVISGEQSGGGWVRLTGTGGVFNIIAGTFTPSLGATTSTFKYTVAGFSPCAGTDESIVTVNISPFVTAGLDGSTTICDNATATIDLFSLITGEKSGGTWVRRTGSGGLFDAIAGTFTPSLGATNSTFRYTIIASAPCQDAESLATVNIIPSANAGTDGSLSICDNTTAIIDLFALISGEQIGGTWTRLTGTGGVFNATTGEFTPSFGATSSSFKYLVNSVSPCVGLDDAIATVTISRQVNAGLDGSMTICNNSTAVIDLFGIISSEQSGGVWTRLTGTGGVFDAVAGTFTPSVFSTNSTFQYALTAISPCSDDVSVATVTIIPKVDAGLNGNITICDNASNVIDLYSLISGEQSGGIWTRLTGTGGTFNAQTGRFIPAIGATSSTFQYKIIGTAPCADAVSVATITIFPKANAGVDGSIKICSNSSGLIDLYDLIFGEQIGGIWTRLTGAGGIFNAAAGTFTPNSTTTSSSFRYAFSGASVCSNDEAIATINIVPQMNAGSDGSTTVCNTTTTAIDLYSLITGEQTGGIWSRLSGTGGVFNASAGTFTPSVNATNSMFGYNLPGISPCTNAQSFATVTITEALIPSFSPITICQNAATPTLPSTSLNGFTGTWSPAIINNQATTTYTFTPTANACATSTTLTVTVLPIAKPNAGLDQITCSTINNANYTLNASPIPIGSTGFWAFVGAPYGASISDIYNPNTTIMGVNTVNTITLSWTITNALGCSASDSVAVGKDNEPPLIDTYNKNSALAGSLTEIGGEAYVCANIVVKELTDNCSTYNDLLSRVTIVRDADNPTRTYLPNFSRCVRVTCADANKNILAQVWSVDKAGNAHFKLTYIAVQDNLGFCGPLTPQTTVSIKTETNRPVNNVTVTAYRGNSAEIATFSQSDVIGVAKLGNLSLGENYQLKATKTDEQYLGVSTLDIMAISQHILGIKPLISPYALLAADINEDGEIDGVDVLLLRNFILRRLPTLPKRAWRFVDSSYVFKQPMQPFAEDFAEIIALSNTEPLSHKAFKAIKTGDVAYSQTANFSELVVRNSRVLTLQTDDIVLEKGKEYALNFTSDNFLAQNFQFTLHFNSPKDPNTVRRDSFVHRTPFGGDGGALVKYIEIGDLPNMNLGNFGLFENALTTSWYGKAHTSNVRLFTLHFTAKNTGLLSDLLSIGSALTPAEAHDAEGNSMAIQLKFNAVKTAQKAFVLHQNYPNPFEKQTKIAFELPAETIARLTIYNIAGQVVYHHKAHYQAGFNEILIEKDVLNTVQRTPFGEGVFYYRLDTPEHSATRKMIRVK